MKRRSLLAMILSLVMCLGVAMPAWANDYDLNNNSTVFMEHYLYDLISGEIQPVNEAGINLNVDIKNNSFDRIDATTNIGCSAREADVITEKKIIDIRKIDDENASDNCESYVANVVFLNKYNIKNLNTDVGINPMVILDKGLEGEYLDVIVHCRVYFDRVNIKELADINGKGYKVTKAVVTYVSAKDPKVYYCSKINITSNAGGCSYETALSRPTSKGEIYNSGDITGLREGQSYSYDIPQKYYYCDDVVYAYNKVTAKFDVQIYNSQVSATSEVIVDVLDD